VIQRLVGDGSRWGLDLKVVLESRELPPAQSLLKYSGELQSNAQSDIVLMDHFPGLPQHDLFSSHQALFAALREWMPRANTPDRVGVRNLSPGVWVGTHSVVSPRATLLGPCWVGRHVYVGDGAVIGPNAIVENGSFIEEQAEVAQSWVGSDTFVGKLARLGESFAWGGTLVNWRSACTTEVPDPFLLCALRHRGAQGRAAHMLARISELFARNKDEAVLLWRNSLLKGKVNGG